MAPTARSAPRAYLLLVCVIATLAGFLFGFDASVINGTVGALSREFGSGPATTGFAVSSVLVGSALGALLAGKYADQFGRKPVMFATAVIFAGGAAGAGAAGSTAAFVVFRLLGGLGVGAASVIAPAYIAEVSPAHLRGRLTTLQQLAIVVGLQCAFLSNFLIAGAAGSAGAPWLMGFQAWRWMIWVQLAPSLIFLAGCLVLPESPRHLIARGRDATAIDLMRRLWGECVDGPAVVAQIRATVSTAVEPRRASLRAPGVGVLLPVVWIGIALAFFQQASGINAVMYFGEYLWAAAGFSEHNGLLINVTLGAVLIASTLVSMTLVDRLGRRPLLLGGSTVMSVMLIVLAAVFLSSARSAGGVLAMSSLAAQVTLIAEHVFIFAFGMTWGPVVWVLLGEMFPNRIRAAALALSAGAQWATAFLVTTTFPGLLATVGLGGMFGLYAVACCVSLWMVHRYVRETKGVTLEAMSDEVR